MSDTLSPELLQKMDAYWRAANYLTVGQIYLKDNPLLEAPLQLEHLKPRLLGHWGTTTGLNFIYVHLNRLIKQNDLDMIYIIGPGHGGPGLVAHTYLEGSYSEIYPNIDRSRNGMQRLFRQFSWPYGIPSHVAPETPGSIHEGGELGYSLAPRLWRRVRQSGPDRRLYRRRRRSGNRPAGHELALQQIPEPGARRRGAADPPPERVQDRQSDRAGQDQPTGADRPAPWLWLRASFRRGRRARRRARAARDCARRVLCGDPQHSKCGALRFGRGKPGAPALADDRAAHPEGLDGPKFVDGKPVEGTWRAHQVPIADFKNPEHLKQLEEWMRSYRPQELFDEQGKFREELAALAPTGRRRMGANPHANGGELLAPLSMPHFREYAVEVASPGGVKPKPRASSASFCVM